MSLGDIQVATSSSSDLPLSLCVYRTSSTSTDDRSSLLHLHPGCSNRQQTSKTPTARKKTSRTNNFRDDRRPKIIPTARKRTAQVTETRNRKQLKPKHVRVAYRIKMFAEIARLQATTETLIPKVRFARLVREILCDCGSDSGVTRLTATALEALQESTEMYMIQQFQDAYLIALHCDRVTLYRNDLILLRFIRENHCIL